MEGLNSEKRLLDFIKSFVLKVMTKIKHFDVALFEANGDISSILPLRMAVVLGPKLAKLRL